MNAGVDARNTVLSELETASMMAVVISAGRARICSGLLMMSALAPPRRSAAPAGRWLVSSAVSRELNSAP